MTARKDFMRGLKPVTSPTPEKIERGFRLMLRETKASERDVIENQWLLGDACKDLRMANKLTQKTIAERMGIDVVRVQTMEQICSVANAYKYWRAVRNDPRED